jgi:hypothetical protein
MAYRHIIVLEKNIMFNTRAYKKITIIQAKLFEPGDEDGLQSATQVEHLIHHNEYTPIEVPYVETLENQRLFGEFYRYYICTGYKGRRWLVEKEEFEATYQLI